MYGGNQIIHAIPYNRPIDSGCPTPFLDTHYQYTTITTMPTKPLLR